MPTFKCEKDMVRGEHDWHVSNDEIAAIKWKDNRAVHVLSNFHCPEQTNTVTRKEKDGQKNELSCPAAVFEYNQNMNCVDKFDQKKQVYAIDRKSHKWWHRIFFHFADSCVVNAYIFFNEAAACSSFSWF